MTDNSMNSSTLESSPSQETSSAGAINDNSKRSISVRINTSDYGRIKAIARRLKIREPEVFRFVLRAGLADIAPLSNSRSSLEDLLSMFATRGRELIEHFKLNARRLNQILNGEDSAVGARIDQADLELLAMTNLPAYMLVLRLQELTGHSVDPAQVHTEWCRYLTEKYLVPKTSQVARMSV